MFCLLLKLPFSLGKHRRTLAALGYLLLCTSLIQILNTSFAQAYAGTYIEVANASNELILTYESDGIYSGVLFEGIGIYSVQANEADTSLKGIILKSRAGAEQDVAFTAQLNDGQLLFTTNLVKSDGELDLSNQSEIAYARPNTFSSSEDLLEIPSESISAPVIQPSGLAVNASSALSNLIVRTGTLVGEVIQADEQYLGGAQLQAPDVGISFQVPSAGTAIHSSPKQTLVIGHTSTLGNVAITALSTGDFASFVASSLKATEDQVFNALSSPVKTEDSYRAAYELKSGSRSSYIEIAALKGPLGNMVLFKAKNRMQEAEDISQVLDMLLSSLVFAEPSEVTLETSIENLRLSSENPEIIKGLLDICSSHEYRLESTEDAQDIQIGLWKPAASLFSSGLVLNSIDGEFDYLPLEGITSAENAVTLEPSPYCQ